MVSFQEVSRLVNGASLVAKELAKRSQAIDSFKNGDFENLISSSLKKALVTATDFTGLTKGQIRRLSNHHQPRSKETIVYFTDSSEIPNSKPSEKQKNNEFAQRAESSSVFTAKDGGEGCGTANSEQFREREFTDLVQTAESSSFNDGDESGRIVSDSETSVRAETARISDFQESKETATVELRKSENSPVAVPLEKRRRPRERRVPSTPFTRALGFAGLGAGLAWGTIQESAKRLVYGAPKSKDQESAVSPFLSEQNAKRLALALCRMRGAALKLGQMLSIQDESLVPAPILAALDIVRQGADVMPRSQLNQVLDAELGSDWTSKLQSFDYEPIAAASIGQVHRAVTKDGIEVAMKIQYPGVADSIESDIENVKLLLDYTNLIPKGLFLDRAMKVAKEELSRECDYELEAKNQKRFRDLLSKNKEFYVPMVIENISSKRVVTTELVSGVPIDKVATVSQETHNYVGKKLLELTLMELFVFRFMQTDPNWSNFLYDETSNMINLIDFGAARDYPKSFVDDYLRMVLACANCDRDKVIEMSKRLGFLTGMESEIMLEAHVQAGFVVGLPFSKPGGYDFRSTNITHSVSNLGATMLRHRLTPPPDEAYSLHRKLSGAFLACMKLGAVVPCRELLLEVYEKYQFGNEGAEVLTTSSMM